jgi:RNA polymerase sigma factor (sigma-70 family)
VGLYVPLLEFSQLQRVGFFFQAPGVSYTLHYARGIHVKRDQSSPAGGANRFLTTRWSVVLVSAQSQAPGCKEALADLCKLYWYPLYAFIRHRGYSPEDAQDLVQGFFLHLIEYKTLSRVDQSKGKFRSFLLASLQNYLANEADRARCLKRGGKAEFVHIDHEEAEDRYGLEPIEELTPEKIFDARWAMALLGEAMNRLGREYAVQGKATTFQALRAFLDPINTKRLPSYEEVAAQLEVSVGSLKTQIHRLRKRYTAIVKEEISRTVSDAVDVDVEIHELCEALIAAEGWVMP